MRSSTLALRVLLLGSLGLTACDVQGSDVSDVDRTKGSGGSSSGGSTGGGGVPSNSDACTNSQPVLDRDTGTFRCAEGYMHRAEARNCQSELPRDITIEWPPSSGEGGEGGSNGVGYTRSSDECERDTDCPAPNSFCSLVRTNGSSSCFFGEPPVPDYARTCVQGCLADADCEADEVCICGSPVGYCHPVSPIAGCHSDADCAGDALCLSNGRTDNYGSHAFACQLPGDECTTDADCPPNPNFCRISAEGRTCEYGAVCGRPFLVEQRARLACATETSTWQLDDQERPMIAPSELAPRLARHWTEIGLMEHASVAAFARFTLQLLNMGAPAETIEASNRAQMDETLHARMAFEIASRYAGRDVGPGALSVQGSLLEDSWEHILATTIEEGCIGETCAAIEAAHAAILCEDPAVARVLERIAEDESRHAALAWRTVAWMIGERPELRAVAARLFEEAAAEAASKPAAHVVASPQSEAERYGALELSTLASCRAEALTEVVLPCVRSLLLSAPVSARASAVIAC